MNFTADELEQLENEFGYGTSKVPNGLILRLIKALRTVQTKYTLLEKGARGWDRAGGVVCETCGGIGELRDFYGLRLRGCPDCMSEKGGR